jgi:hypothetical protein
MSGYLFPLMVSLSNHGRDHVRVHPFTRFALTCGAAVHSLTPERRSGPSLWECVRSVATNVIGSGHTPMTFPHM